MIEYHSRRGEWKKGWQKRTSSSGISSSKRITFIDIMVIILFLALVYPLASSYSYKRAKGGYRFHLKVTDLEQDTIAVLEVRTAGIQKTEVHSSKSEIISVWFLVDGVKSPLLEDLLPHKDDSRIIRYYFPGNLTGNLQCFIQFKDQKMTLRRPVNH